MKRTKPYPLIKFVLLIMLVSSTIAVVACGAAPSTGITSNDGPTQSDEKMTIKLVLNSWSGSAVNVAVAKILIEEQMGYPVEFRSMDTNAQWLELSSGAAHASLEIWPNDHLDSIAQFIDEQQTVEDVGLLGFEGKIGWFMPAYMLEIDPELATWQGFQKPETAKLFATEATNGRGQFLAGDESWSQHDADIIHNLGLDFEVVVAGSEVAILDALDTAYSQQQPILFYLWTPHASFAEYDLVEVELPPYNAECYETINIGGVDCGYPSEKLFKAVSTTLKEQAPEVDQFLRNFTYTAKDQIEMIAALELDGKTPEEAARAWIEAHPETWQAWIP